MSEYVYRQPLLTKKGRLKEPGCWYGIEEFQEAAGARYLFPMHLFGDPGIIERLKERIRTHIEVSRSGHGPSEVKVVAAGCD